MVHEGLWEQLMRLEPESTAKRAKCHYIDHPQKRYVVTLLKTDYIVNLSDRQVFQAQTASTFVPADYLEQLCLLAYLINAKDIPLANKLVGAEALQAGEFFFRGLHSLPTGKLEAAFGQFPEKLLGLAEKFNAGLCEFGDASIQLYILPRIPVTIVIWRCCEEFAARASILFDQTAAMHLPLDALLAGVNLAVESLVKTADKNGRSAC